MKILSLILVFLLLINLIPLTQAPSQGKTSILVFVAEKPLDINNTKNIEYSPLDNNLYSQDSLFKKILNKFKSLIF